MSRPGYLQQMILQYTYSHPQMNQRLLKAGKAAKELRCLLCRGSSKEESRRKKGWK